MVGLQPSATAVALKTWVNLQDAPQPDEVWLLATPQVRSSQASRLVEFCETLGLRGRVIAVNTSLEPGRGERTVSEALREELASINPPPMVIFYGEPGLKALALAAAQELARRQGTTKTIHTDSEYLYEVACNGPDERWSKYALQDLGMKELLNLYDLKVSIEPWRFSKSELHDRLSQLGTQLPNDIRKGVRFLTGGRVPVLHLAYERRGWFYGLRLIQGGQDSALTQTRNLIRMALELKNLRPVLAVVSPREPVLQRARSSGLEAIAWDDDSKLQAWVSRRAAAPGHASERREDPRAPVQLQSLQGRGGNGRPLAVWMGADPSATLVSLFTHQPAEAWVLYDHQTPVVKERVRRLQECLGSVPVGTAHFVPSDRMGRGILRYLTGIRNLEADVSPGTKMQSYALARIPGAELWSLHGRVAKAVRLDGGDERPLRGPNIATQARLCGGSLLNPGEDAKNWGQKQLRFLTLLGKCLATCLNERPIRRLDPLPSLKCSDGWVTVSAELNEVQVKYRGEAASSSLVCAGGAWLERLTAAALAQAGADEIRTNLTVAYPDGDRRDEVDAIARFGHRFLVASCKLKRYPEDAAAPSPPGRDDLNLQAQEVEAVALSCAGHQAIPVVIRPKLPAGLIEIRLHVRKGAVYLDLPRLFLSPLREVLEDIWSARSQGGE